MDENELVMIADNESTNGHPKVPTDNNYPLYILEDFFFDFQIADFLETVHVGSIR